MKKFATIALLLFACSSGASPFRATPYWIILERPTTKDLNKVCFLDSLRGWVAGKEGTILKTTDGGESWTVQDSRTLNNVRDIFMVNANVGWAVTGQLPDSNGWAGTLLLKTTNGGIDWTSSPHPNRYYYAVYFHDSLSGWMGGASGYILGTTDGGESWSEAQVDSTPFSHLTLVKFNFFSRQYGYAVGGELDYSGAVWRTTDHGTHWTSFGVGPEPVNGIHFIDSVSVIGIGGDLDYGTGRIRTTDMGGFWGYTYLNIFGEGTSLAFRTAAEGWSALGFTGTIICTTDTGRTWTEMYTPDSTAVYDVVFPDSRHGFMVGKRGTILRYNTAILHAGDGEDPGAVSSAMLHQNYPNPFNAGTNISLVIPARGLLASFVQLKVIDMLGREVATLLDGIQDGGFRSVRWDASGMAGGVYFYVLRTDKEQIVRRMVLIR